MHRRGPFAIGVAIVFLALCNLYYIHVAKYCDGGTVSWSNVADFAATVLPMVSKDIIVRSVYLDDRPRSGHVNASVFMVEACRHEKLIVGCQVGSHFGRFIQVRPLAQMDTFVHWKHSYVNHDLLMIDCFDLPILNGSRAFLLFKKKKSYSANEARTIYSVESERPLFIPSVRISHQDDIKLLVCVATARYTNYDRRLTVYDMIYHWIKYQRVIGVDHVHITAHPSFLTVGTLQNDVIRKAILDQFISIEFWEPWLNETDNYHGHSQMLAYQNCAYRFRGTYDYLMMCDTDDFFMPRVTNQPKFQYYIKKWCQYGTCRFHWVERYPDCGIDKEKITSDGNITKALKSNAMKLRKECKSLHISSSVLDVGIHKPMETMPRVSVITVPKNVAHFSHVRHGKKPLGGFDNCYIRES